MSPNRGRLLTRRSHQSSSQLLSGDARMRQSCWCVRLFWQLPSAVLYICLPVWAIVCPPGNCLVAITLHLVSKWPVSTFKQLVFLPYDFWRFSRPSVSASPPWSASLKPSGVSLHVSQCSLGYQLCPPCGKLLGNKRVHVSDTLR